MELVEVDIPEEEVDKMEQMAVQDMDKAADTVEGDTGQASGDTVAVDIASKDNNDPHDFPKARPSGQAARIQTVEGL